MTQEASRGNGPVLGYMSLAQLQEFACHTDISPSDSGSKATATKLFLGTLRLNLEDTQLFGEVDADHPPELYVNAGDHRRFGWPKLINMDTFRRLLEDGELERPHKPRFEGWEPLPTYIGDKCIQLATGYLNERIRFLGGQQG